MDVIENQEDSLVSPTVPLYHRIVKTLFKVGSLEDDYTWRTEIHSLQEEFQRETVLLEKETRTLQEVFPDVSLLYSITDTYKETGEIRNLWYEAALTLDEGYLLVAIVVKHKTKFRKETHPYYKLFSHDFERIKESSYINQFPLCVEERVAKTVKGFATWLQEKSPYRLCYLLENGPI